MLPQWVEHLGGIDIPLVILGDPAYPLLFWLMKAFPDNGRLTSQQKLFNYHLRVVVEHAYGRLKGRWQCLLKRIDIDVRNVPELITACCTLHNICEVHGDSFNEDWLEGVEVTSEVEVNDVSATQSENGDSIRRALISYFQQTCEATT